MFFSIYADLFFTVERFIFTIRTCSVKIQRVVIDIEIHEIGNGVLDLLYAGIAKFNDFTTFLTYQMIVLFALIGFFKLRNVLAELVLHHQVALQKQFDRVVKRRSANPVILVFHTDIQGLYIEMIVPGINFVQNGIPLGCFPMSSFFQVTRENLFYGIFRFTTYHSTEPFISSIKLGQNFGITYNYLELF